ncbi:hypothetical protein CCM_08947 [Cordyceps militaris CM01]|uniref:Uncharacterized protein n=2 Tax=Cordyceps militaris TaxID=73501 RepID=G3JSQ4_CORMM|nr:uncharacterized protein CCM_08947 [Cordyceps militaris CM01]ATY63685.1 hypothetical protein A9K55_009198 [Cordyceps militaris]EGX88900.1 hypothetical protein CCM_08947 [Cordyceps militaris CM01]
MISSVRSTGHPFPNARALQPAPETPDSADAELTTEYAIGDRLLTVCLTIFIFRGEPDAYYNRHVLLYFSSPDDPTMFETVHAQRQDAHAPWNVYHLHAKTDWSEPSNYHAHVNAGAVLVRGDALMMPVAAVAATDVTGKHADGGWNCQNFVLEGLQTLVRLGLQTQDWYDAVEEELLDKIIEGAVG